MGGFSDDGATDKTLAQGGRTALANQALFVEAAPGAGADPVDRFKVRSGCSSQPSPALPGNRPAD